MINTTLGQIPFEFSCQHLVLPLSFTQSSEFMIRCLAARTSVEAAFDNLSLYLDAPLELIPTAEPELRDLITRTYQQQMSDSDALQQASTSPSADSDRLDVESTLQSLTDRDLLASGDKAPVAKLVDALLFDALAKQASDLHVHPYPDKLIIRYRIDGVLHNAYTPPIPTQSSTTRSSAASRSSPAWMSPKNASPPTPPPPHQCDRRRQRGEADRLACEHPPHHVRRTRGHPPPRTDRQAQSPLRTGHAKPDQAFEESIHRSHGIVIFHRPSRSPSPAPMPPQGGTPNPGAIA